MTASKGIGRGGKRANSGPKAADGASIVAVITVGLDQLSYDLLQQHSTGNDSVAFRRMCLLFTQQENSAAPRTASTTRKAVKVDHAPVRRIVSEQMAGGGKYNFYTLARKQEEADREYEEAMAAHLRKRVEVAAPRL